MTRTILHQSSWANTTKGTAIPLYKSCVENESPLLFIGGVHGDEPEGVQLAEDLLRWLQKNNNEALRSWILIPCLNVDGFKENKRTNSNGVDLNRNFPSKDWCSTAKSDRYFPGHHACSENETKSVVQLIEEEKPQLIIHFHSWEPCVVYTGKPGAFAASLIGQDTNYPIKEEIGYPTPGSLGQYGWLTCHIPVICIEAQEKSDLSMVWKIFGNGLLRILSKGNSF